MALYEFNGKRPRVDPSAYVHPSAVLIGDVTVAACCYIGPLASLRGDFGAVVVERGSNVQDSCVLHTGVANAAAGAISAQPQRFFRPYVTYPCATLINCTRLRTLNNCRKRRR